MRSAWKQLACIDGNVAVLVHGPNGCGQDFSLPNRQSEKAVCYSTDLSERDVIMGGEDALASKIGSVCERNRPDVLFVLGTCVSEIIGDDARGVCAQAAAKMGVAVIFLPTSGLVEMDGGDIKSIVIDALIDKVMKPGRRVGRSVNFISLDWPNYTHVKEELASALTSLNIKLHALLAGNPTLTEIRMAPRAALNVIIDDSARDIGMKMQDKFGTPFLAVPRPMGIAGTTRMFELVAEAFGCKKNEAALVEGWRRRELKRLAKEHPDLKGKSAAVLVRRPYPYLIGAFSELGLDVTTYCSEPLSVSDKRELARYGVRFESESAPSSDGWSKFDLVFMADPNMPAPKSHLPMRHMRPPSTFILYSGMHELARELEAELSSRFFRIYGRYCA